MNIIKSFINQVTKLNNKWGLVIGIYFAVSLMIMSSCNAKLNEEENEKTLEKLVDLAIQLENDGEDKKITKIHKKIIKLDPNIGYLLRGLYCITNVNYKQAIDDLNKVIEVDTNDISIKKYAYKGRSDAYLFIGNYEQNIIDLNEAIRLNNSILESYEKALDDYNNAIELGIDKIDFLYSINKQMDIIDRNSKVFANYEKNVNVQRAKKIEKTIEENLNNINGIEKVVLNIKRHAENKLVNQISAYESVTLIITPESGYNIIDDIKVMNGIKQILKYVLLDLPEEMINIMDNRGNVFNNSN